MKTDSLFYELFKLHPASLFELAGIEADGEYVFESITVKSTEKRTDGFFRRRDGKGSNFFLSRFPEMTRKEIEKMIQLTPLDKTVAGQELIQMGMEKGFIDGIEKGILKGIEKGRIEGLEKGIEKGKVIGKIHLAQRFLKRRVTSEKKLRDQSLKELRAILKQLEAEMKIS